MPDPYWDTMLAACILVQDEDHNLKYLYNKYVAEEDEGINRFDTLFKRNYLRLCANRHKHDLCRQRCFDDI